MSNVDSRSFIQWHIFEKNFLSKDKDPNIRKESLEFLSEAFKYFDNVIQTLNYLLVSDKDGRNDKINRYAYDILTKSFDLGFSKITSSADSLIDLSQGIHDVTGERTADDEVLTNRMFSVFGDLNEQLEEVKGFLIDYLEDHLLNFPSL